MADIPHALEQFFRSLHTLHFATGSERIVRGALGTLALASSMATNSENLGLILHSKDQVDSSF